MNLLLYIPLLGCEEIVTAKEPVRIVASLEEATSLMNEITGAGDTVLFENDLPDNYTES